LEEVSTISSTEKEIFIDALNQLEDGICIVDDKTQVIFLNNQAARFFGVPEYVSSDINGAIWRNQNFSELMLRGGVLPEIGQAGQFGDTERHFKTKFSFEGRLVEVSKTMLESGGVLIRVIGAGEEKGHEALAGLDDPFDYQVNAENLITNLQPKRVDPDDCAMPAIHEWQKRYSEKHLHFGLGGFESVSGDFFEEERLSAYEFGEIEASSERTSGLLQGARSPNNIFEASLLRALYGNAEPKTILEVGIVKLVHQAMVLANVAFSDDELFDDEGDLQDLEELSIETTEFYYNDISDLSSDDLRLVFYEIIESILVQKAEDYEPEIDSDEDEVDPEKDEEEELLYEELADSSEEYSRSHSDGWFYDD
jgi:hypothetical protein